MLVPLYLPRYETVGEASFTVLAADIGGTKTAMGLFSVSGKELKLVKESTYLSNEHPSFQAVLKRFLSDHQLPQPDRLSIGVAGPVLDGKVKLTNLPWVLDRKQLITDTGVKEASLINDLEATAYGLAGLNEEYIATIHPGNEQATGNIAVLAPGTGLGEAGLYWDGQGYHPFATEGGHCHFSPRNALDVELYQHLSERHQTVSWEHLISGRGIYRIYRFLRDVKGRKEPAWLTEKLAQDDPAAVISHTAMRELDDTCVETMKLFVGYMATEASNLVLKLKATGGVLLGGGISPKIFPLLKTELFYEQFIHSHRMQHLLKEVPIRVILDSHTALLGAAYCGAYGTAPD